MYIIVVGGGKVGYHLSKALLAEEHEVLIIERNKSRVDFICGELGSICLLGDGCETSTLADAGTSRADMLIAVTGDDEDNLVACQIAKYTFKVPRTIARSNDPKNEMLFALMGIDVTVSSTDVIMEHIQQEVPTHMLTRLCSFRDNGVELVEIKITDDSKSIGHEVRDILLPPGSQLLLFIRPDQKPQTASPDIVIQSGDQIIALTPIETEEQLKSSLKGG
jgi:trk system potassium uptake protein TrkA